MQIAREENYESLWITDNIKVYCTIYILRQKYIECLNLIKSNRNRSIGTYDAF